MKKATRKKNQPKLEEDEVLETVMEEPALTEKEASAPAETPATGAAETEPLSAEALLEAKIQQLEAQLAETERKAAEYLDGLQRSQASFANYRKRTEAEQVAWRSVANAALLSRFLPVLDDFDRAFQALPKEFAGHPWLEGITLIQRKIAGVLEAENVKPIEVQPGAAFDPLYHQAILYQEVPGFEDGQIVAEVERGYILGERVLRPASVVVAKVPPRMPEPQPEPESEAVEAEVLEEVSTCGDDEPGECPAPQTEQDSGCCHGDDAPCDSQDAA
ncbi:MAG: nucleotide exchange factor GrpE [Anaerolineae bacterium]